MHRPLVAYPDGVDSAAVAPATVAELLGIDAPDVLLGWSPAAHPWLADPELRGLTIMAGYATAAAVADHRLRYVPVRLGSVPRLVHDLARPDVAVVSGVARGTGFAYRGTVGWAPAAVSAAGQVVVEVEAAADDLGGPLIEAEIAGVVDRPADAAKPAASRELDDVDRAIGCNVVSIFPDDPTIQLGPGGIAEAVIAGIDRPVSVFSGLLTESLAELHRRDLLVGTVTAGYPWGDVAIAELAAEGRLRLEPVTVTHNPAAIAAIDRFVGCNTALQVGLDGSVNVERIGTRVVAGIGGHADFCAGAARSAGGLSVIALRSTTRRAHSTVVVQPDVVSTPRCDVDVVVTEHGVADLRNVDDSERARRLIAIAHPDHRAALAEAV